MTDVARSASPFASDSPAAALVGMAALFGSIVALCVGTSYAKQLFPSVGAEGATALRVAFSAIALCAIWRPWRARLSRRDLRAVALYGATIGTMNLLFYKSIETIPLGLAIAIEFSGPLAVALASSRRAVDFLWVALAALGLGLLLPVSDVSSNLDPAGVGYAIAAAICWAGYIFFGKRVGHLHGGRTVALGMTFAAVVAVPAGAVGAGTALLAPAVLVFGAGVALVSSALPYSLEMVALKRLPPHAFGVFLSLEPAVGALAGLGLLGERLSAIEWLAITLVVAASAGVAVSTHRARIDANAQAMSA